VSEVFNRHGVQHHLYADDKQAYVNTPVSDVHAARATLEGCIRYVSDWCSSRRLQLNETKTELIWFGSKKILGKVPESELNLTVDSTTIQPVKSVRDLGVQLDSQLSMKAHVSKVAGTEMEMGHGSRVMGQMGHHFWMGHMGHGSPPVTH